MQAIGWEVVGFGWTGFDWAGLRLIELRKQAAGKTRKARFSVWAWTTGANVWLVVHSFDFCSDGRSAFYFHTREIVKEGVGHLRSYRKSTERLGWLKLSQQLY